jgi:hypothetical protein
MPDLGLGEEILRERLGITEKRFCDIGTIFYYPYLQAKISYL